MLPYAEHRDAVRFLEEHQLHRHQNKREAERSEVLLERFYRCLREKKFKALEKFLDAVEKE